VAYTPQPSTADLAHRLGASAFCCAVVSSIALSPCVREVVLRGDAEVLAGRPGNDVMVRVESADGRFVRRRFSVRSVNADANTFSLWVTTDHEGPASRWARTAIADDHVDVIGPRGKTFLDTAADWHLFVGDLTGLAAFYRLAESITPPGRAIFVVEVDHPDDMLTTRFDAGIDANAIFIERRERAMNDPTGLLNGLAAFAMPPDVGHAYVTGEFSVVRTLRASLADRGLGDDAVSHKSYWRLGRVNADHGEPDKNDT